MVHWGGQRYQSYNIYPVIFTTDADSYSVVRYVTLHGTVCPDYASLHRDGSHVVLCSAQPYLLFHDSTKPVVQPASETGTESKATGTVILRALSLYITDMS